MNSPLRTAIKSIEEIEQYEMAKDVRERIILSFCLPLKLFCLPHQYAWEHAKLNIQHVRIEWSKNDND